MGLFTGPSIRAVLPSIPLDGVPPAPFIPIPKSVLSAVLEPGAWAMTLAGSALTGGARRRRARRVEAA